MRALLVLCTLFFVLSVGQARLPKTQLSQADQLRKDFLLLAEDLWTQLEDVENNEKFKHQAVPPEVTVLRQIEKFGDILQEDFPNDLDYGIEILDRYWVTGRVKVHLRSIYALYETFRRFQKQQTAEGRVPSPQKAWLDFTESVLHDSRFEVNSSLEAIWKIIDEDQLFAKSLKHFSDNLLDHGVQILTTSWFWKRTVPVLQSIAAKYEVFRRYQKNGTPDISETIDTLTMLGEIVDGNDLFLEALKEMDTYSVCNAQQSPQQLLYNLYNTVAVTELKGYTMVQFSYMLLKLYGKGNFTKEAELSKDRFKERSLNTISAVKTVMEKASRELWRCEPKQQIAGETYLEITQLLQGYVQNEVDLNSEGTCRENCAEYTYTKSHSCFQNLYCRQQRRCKGKILKCQYIDSDMWICPSNATTHRRYEYVEYENGRVLGRKQNCPKGRIEVESWWRWLFWHCSYCMCLCDEEGIYSDRYISLRTVISDFRNNKVITGLRFTKHNRLIHLQIQEGELLPHGVINNETLRWVPVDNFQIQDRNVFNGQDYHTLTWENRAIDLDDVYAHLGHVLIGVRFKKVGSHLNFEILASPFDFETGLLSNPEDKSVWMDNVNTAYNTRKKLSLDRLDIPTRAISPAHIDSKSDMYLEFTNTDMDKDAAQTTVPFFDAQNVVSLLPVPLAGAGIYHKGQHGFGGYIGPKIMTYDYSNHLMTSLDMEQDDYDLPAN